MQERDASLGRWVIRHRWWIIACAVILTATAASGIRFLKINNDMRVFFSERNPQLRALEALENTYTRDENVLFLLAPEDGDVFGRRTLGAIAELTGIAWQTPHSSRVDSITNFQHSRGEDDELIVEDLFYDVAGLTDAQLAARRRVALAEPVLVNRLVSAAGDVTAINVTVITPGRSHNEVVEVTEFARRAAAQFREKNPDIELYLTGGIVVDTSFGEAGEDDATRLVPIMFAVLIVVAGLALRSVTGTMATLVVILSAMLAGMGLAGWLGIELTAASVTAPVIILTLAVADSVHLLETVFQEMRLGNSREDAIAESIRANLRAVLLTSLTTAIGFLSMNFSDAPPFRDLGNIVAMGVLAAFFYSIFLLPALVAVLPLRVAAVAKAGERPPCDRWADFVIGRRRPIFWATLAFSVAVATGIGWIELDDDYIKYFDESYEIRRATDFMEERLTGFNVIEYSLDSGESSGINGPDYLATVERFADWYRRQAGVVHVTAITDVMKRLNKNMHGDDESRFRIPERRDMAAQYLLLYEMSLPFGLDLNNQINVDKSASRMTVILKDVTAREIRDMDSRARDWLSDNAPERMFTYGTGLSVIWAHLTDRNIRNMLIASFGALILISLLLMIALRSWRLGLLSLIPNLAPALVAFGIWGLTVGQVGLALSVVVSVTLGVVVDDTVHFLSRYLRARRERGMIPTEAVRHAFNTVGTAMWITTLALVAGFMVLAFSHYKMSADMGIMSAITIGLALALDFLLLPTLLIAADRR